MSAELPPLVTLGPKVAIRGAAGQSLFSAHAPPPSSSWYPSRGACHHPISQMRTQVLVADQGTYVLSAKAGTQSRVCLTQKSVLITCTASLPSL